jgi:isoamylase
MINNRDNSEFCPLGMVVDNSFTWGNDHPPNVPWHRSVIYETHVKSQTFLHPGTHLVFVSCSPHSISLTITSTLHNFLLLYIHIFVDIPEHVRGTYAGLCSEPFIEHLKKLGVTALELEPIHHHVDEKNLLDKVPKCITNTHYLPHC